MTKNRKYSVLRSALYDATLLLHDFYKKINYQGYKIKFSDLKVTVAAFWNKGILYFGEEMFPNHPEFKKRMNDLCDKYEIYSNPYLILPPDPKHLESKPKSNNYNKKQTQQSNHQKVTTNRLHMFMRLCGIHLEPRMVDHIIDCVEIIEKKGGEASVNDAVELEAKWKKQNS